jgi:hypothetical protein
MADVQSTTIERLLSQIESLQKLGIPSETSGGIDLADIGRRFESFKTKILKSTGVKKAQLNPGLVKFGAKPNKDDPQCAWELYTEIVTRVAVVGKRRDLTCEDFCGELYAESLDSLYNFFRECRGIMRKFPVGKLKETRQEYLGVLINRILNDVFRPFLEEWSGPFRRWWATAKNERGSPCEIQNEFPQLRDFLADWRDLRPVMRRVQETLRDQYKLIPLE